MSAINNIPNHMILSLESLKLILFNDIMTNIRTEEHSHYCTFKKVVQYQ